MQPALGTRSQFVVAAAVRAGRTREAQHARAGKIDVGHEPQKERRPRGAAPASAREAGRPGPTGLTNYLHRRPRMHFGWAMQEACSTSSGYHYFVRHTALITGIGPYARYHATSNRA